MRNQGPVPPRPGRPAEAVTTSIPFRRTLRRSRLHRRCRRDRWRRRARGVDLAVAVTAGPRRQRRAPVTVTAFRPSELAAEFGQLAPQRLERPLQVLHPPLRAVAAGARREPAAATATPAAEPAGCARCAGARPEIAGYILAATA